METKPTKTSIRNARRQNRADMLMVWSYGDAVHVLDGISKRFDTTTMGADLFAQLCRTVVSHLKGGASVEQTINWVCQMLFDAK